MLVAQIVQRAGTLNPLNSILIARNGKLIAERYFRGMQRDRAVNIKSASKSVLSALIGIAVQRGELRLDQPIAELFPEYIPQNSDPAKRTITVRHLLTMTAGIESTSFANYGAWVSSGNWARSAIQRPMVCAPDACMTYSTGNSHLLSVALTRKSGIDTRTYANRHLFSQLGTTIAPWTRDPQGFLLGGNEMNLTPRQLLLFGQLYLDNGSYNGKQILSPDWIRASWGEYATSPWNGHRYGYHWWTRKTHGRKVHFAWGYGGQFVFVVPELALVVVATSALQARSDTRHNRDIHNLIDTLIAGVNP